MVPGVRIRSGTLDAEGYRRRDRMCPVQSRMFQSVPRVGPDGREHHEKIYDHANRGTSSRTI